jgi:cytoskeletal protein CcmA (bactofilin family)
MSNLDTPSSGFRPEIARRPDLSGISRPSATAVAQPPAAAPAKTEGPDPNTLIVGRQISLTGQIAACDKLIIEGKVEASLSDSRFIEISETGMFKGTAEIEEAEIRGRFEGKLSVRGRLLIRGTGKVIGEIVYGQLEIECGGQISGIVETFADQKAGTRSMPSGMSPAPMGSNASPTPAAAS